MARADRESEYKRSARNAKKADIIIGIDKEISAKVEELNKGLQATNAKIDLAIAKMNRQGGVSAESPNDTFESLNKQYSELRRELDFIAAQNESVFTELKRIIREWGGVQNPYRAVQSAQANVQAEIDYDKLAQKVIELMPAQEHLSADYIACKVAEQIVLPDSVSSAPSAAAAEIAPSPVAYTVSAPVDLNIDEDELADRIALKVGSIKAEDFDIIVDDDGCSSISKGIVEKLDYDAISYAVAEKLRPALDGAAEDTDYEEMAARISEKITVAGINEDAIADKAAAALSNYLPEVDADEIADKVAGQVAHCMPNVEVDSDAICKNITDKLIENQENHDYDIVIDEDGVNKITECVTVEVNKYTDSRFKDVNRRIDELKALIAGGVLIRQVAAASTETAETPAADEALVTVSEVVEPEKEDEQLTIDSVNNTEESQTTGEEVMTDDRLLGEMVEELDEVPSKGEFTSADLWGENGGGVDFEHMMKYNRSFIARIIQSTDEQKQYYGQVKTALLSYAKVNSSLAWGSERFNKGRETIARFKIRGKTLCLYLALSPSEYKTSVYHHIDVSDNKSMHGTPMMVKIKSPLGAKKAIRLIDELLTQLGGVKRNRVIERDYAAMYPYESIEELIEDGLVKEVGKNE